jgi:membrane protease YdiL (CAAX protease family)
MSHDAPTPRRQAWAWALRTTAFALLGMLAASMTAQVAFPGDRGLAMAVLVQGLVFLGIGLWGRPSLTLGALERWPLLSLGLPMGLLSTWVGEGVSRMVGAPPEGWSTLSALAVGPESALILIAAGIVAPLGEELLFRGAIFGALARAGGAGLPIVGSAALFGLMHLTPGHAAAAFVSGLCLGWMRAVTGSVWPGVVAHALNNLLWWWIASAGAPPSPSPSPAILGLCALAWILAIRQWPTGSSVCVKSEPF